MLQSISIVPVIPTAPSIVDCREQNSVQYKYIGFNRTHSLWFSFFLYSNHESQL